MTQRAWWVTAAALVMLAAGGCGGPGQTVGMRVNADMAPSPVKLQQALRITVVPFEDARTDKTAIGRWQHYVETNVDTLISAQGSAAEQITGFVAGYLKNAGFQVSLAKAGEPVSPGDADVVLTGQIESYWNEAVRRFFGTDMSSQNRLIIKASNADGSVVRTSVSGEGTRTVFIFDLEDLERLNDEALGQSMIRFLGELAVADRAFKPRR